MKYRVKTAAILAERLNEIPHALVDRFPKLDFTPPSRGGDAKSNDTHFKPFFNATVPTCRPFHHHHHHHLVFSLEHGNQALKINRSTGESYATFSRNANHTSSPLLPAPPLFFPFFVVAVTAAFFPLPPPAAAAAFSASVSSNSCTPTTPTKRRNKRWEWWDEIGHATERIGRETKEHEKKGAE